MAQPAPKLDPLLKQVEDVRAFLESSKIPIFLAVPDGHKGASAFWDEAHGGDWKEFLGAAKSMGVKGVYLDWQPFEELELNDILATIEGGFQNSSGVDVEVKDVEKFRPHIGMTAMVEIVFIVDSVAHWYQRAADWFERFEELTERAKSSDPAVDMVAVRKWANELANDPRFKACKNYGQREYLLEQVAGDKLDELPKEEVISRAESIFQLEIKPTLDEQLAQEARALKKQGMTNTGIAQKLGLPKDKVSGILNE